jgi:uncharacterized membrane protein YeaQ/YmgE (transglycosylase-associated protein family)
MIISQIFQVLGLILIGAVIGVLARLVIPGRQAIGLLRTMLVGIVGAIIGGLLASLVGLGEVFELNFVGFILALVVSVVLLGAAERSGMLTDSKRGQIERRPR